MAIKWSAEKVKGELMVAQAVATNSGHGLYTLFPSSIRVHWK